MRLRFLLSTNTDIFIYCASHIHTRIRTTAKLNIVTSCAVKVAMRSLCIRRSCLGSRFLPELRGSQIPFWMHKALSIGFIMATLHEFLFPSGLQVGLITPSLLRPLYISYKTLSKERTMQQSKCSSSQKEVAN